MVFKLTRLKQNIFVGYGMLQLFLFKIFGTPNANFHDNRFVLVNQ
jgi:hypothetical protein